jgi:hypothetical protein
MPKRLVSLHFRLLGLTGGPLRSLLGAHDPRRTSPYTAQEDGVTTSSEPS